MIRHFLVEEDQFFFLVNVWRHLVGVAIEAYHCIITLGLFGLLLNGEAVAFFIELCHAIAFRICYSVAENRSLHVFLGILIVANKLFANDKSLCQTARNRLFRVLEAHAVVRTNAQQPLNPRKVIRRTDTYPRQHERADGIIGHRHVIYRQELLAKTLGDGVKSGTGITDKDNSFHIEWLLFIICSYTLQLILHQTLISTFSSCH